MLRSVYIINNTISIGTVMTKSLRIWYDYRNANINNAIFKHFYEENHSVSLNNDKFDIVCKISDTNKLKLVETILIQNTDNFNIHQCNFILGQFTNNYIKSTVFTS